MSVAFMFTTHYNLETNFVRYELQKKNLESCVRDLTGAISAFEIC